MSNSLDQARDNRKRKCELCLGEIPAEAVKCLHCGEWIGEAAQTPGLVQGSSSARAVSQGIKMKNFSKMAFKSKLQLLIVGLIAISIGILGVIVGITDEMTNPKMKDTIASFGLLVIVAMWIIVPIIAIPMMTKSYYKE